MQEAAYEEDTNTVFQKSITIMGGLGRYVYPVKKSSVLDVVLYSPKYGKLWYGDADMNDWTTQYSELMQLDESAEWQLVPNES